MSAKLGSKTTPNSETMKDYLSYSQLKAFAKSPNHYLAYLEQVFEPTPQMTLGSAIHCRFLEPKAFPDRYIAAPKIDRRTKDGKAAYELFLSEKGNKEELTQDQLELVYTLQAKLTETVPTQFLTADTEVEKFGVIHGERFKAIADMVGDTWVADLKTCADASPEGFMRAAHNLDYHLQSAIYRAVFGVSEFYWIAAETSAPFNVQVYKQSEEAKLFSDRRLYNLIQAYQRWDGNPQGYSSQILSLDLPRWAN